MRSRAIIRGTILVSAAGALLAGEARAQNRDKAWEVLPQVGYVFFGAPNLDNGTTVRDFPAPTNTRDIRTVTSEIDNSPSFGFRFGYHFSKKQMIEFGLDSTSTKGTFHMHKVVYDMTPPVPPNPPVKSDTVESETVSIDVFNVQVNYVYNFFLQHRGKVVGFVSGGGGLTNSSTFGQTAQQDLEPVIDFLVGDENDFLFNYGAGMRFFGSEKVGFRIDARQIRFHSSTRGNQVQSEVSAGLTLVLGGA